MFVLRSLNRMSSASFVYPVTKRKDEQVKQIELITGGKVDFWSLEEPDSGGGKVSKRQSRQTKGNTKQGNRRNKGTHTKGY